MDFSSFLRNKWVWVGGCVVLILGMVAFGVDPTVVWNTAMGIAQ